MNIHLPQDVERTLEAIVHSGRFASIDDAMTEAARLLLRELSRSQAPSSLAVPASTPPADPILGLMRDDAELMDDIVADAYRQRGEESWRDLNL